MRDRSFHFEIALILVAGELGHAKMISTESVLLLSSRADVAGTFIYNLWQ